MKSNHLNTQVNRNKRKKNYHKSNNIHKEQQKDKLEDAKTVHQNDKMWGRKVRKSQLFFF